LETALNSIREFAENVTFEELEPLFGTAAKKTGTRIGVILTLNVLLKKGQEKNQAVKDFIQSCLTDENDILQSEAEKFA
jgi:glutaminyl-tRNA synthetase